MINMREDLLNSLVPSGAAVSENAAPSPPPRSTGGGPRLELDLLARLGLDALPRLLQDNVNAVGRLERWLNSAGNTHPRPRIWRASRVTSAGAATYSVLQFQTPTDTGGPNGGYRWWIGAHFIQGTDPFTVVANSVAALYVGAIPPGDSTVAPDIEAIDSSIRYPVTTLPWGGTFAPEAVGFGVNDTVYYVVKSAGNNQKLTASLIVYELWESQKYFTRPARDGS